ncbi:MAG: hypothetical protein D6686_12890, partial [Alphaproteobacteria bacterium]
MAAGARRRGEVAFGRAGAPRAVPLRADPGGAMLSRPGWPRPARRARLPVAVALVSLAAHAGLAA